jgi:glycine cleavage system transcriptional repressor
MKQHVILTAMGKDRVGIVDDLSAAILDTGCNIEESKMALLGGEFVSILLISGESERVGRLSGELPALGERVGLSIELRNTEPPRQNVESRPYLLESVSLDTPGIVHAVTSILRREHINIEDLETETTAAPWTGAPMFVMKARIAVPSGLSVRKLRAELDELSSSHDLDIRLDPISVASGDF